MRAIGRPAAITARAARVTSVFLKFEGRRIRVVQLILERVFSISRRCCGYGPTSI
jgi:hypothetical protein